MSEPTEEMILAGIEAANRTMPYVSDAQCVTEIWKAMQAAKEWNARAIPDTHRIMPVRLTEKMIEAALPQLMREDEDKYRAIGQLICVWDALIDAAKEQKTC
jgi:hypothetical protein